MTFKHKVGKNRIYLFDATTARNSLKENSIKSMMNITYKQKPDKRA